MKIKYFRLLVLLLPILTAVQAQLPSTLYVIVEDAATSTYEDYYDLVSSGSNMRTVTVYAVPGKQYYFDTDTQGNGSQYGFIDPNIGQSETPPVAPNLDIFTSSNTIASLISAGEKFSVTQGEAYEFEIDLSTGVTQIKRRVFNAVVYDPSSLGGINDGTLYPMSYLSTDEGKYTVSNISIPLGNELRFISRQGAFLGVSAGDDPTDLTGGILNDTGSNNTNPLAPPVGTYDITLSLGTGFNGGYTLSSPTLSNTSLVTNTFQVFPNPIDSYVYVSTDRKGKFQIVSVFGQVMISGDIEDGENKIQLYNLASGSYFLTITSEEGVITKQIIKS